MKFKKSLAALLAAVMVIGMVSCGIGSDSDDEDEDEVASSAAEEVEEAGEADVQDTETEDAEAGGDDIAADSDSSEAEEADVTEDSEDSVDSEEDTSDDSASADTGYADGVFTSDSYKLSVDESIWEYSEQASTDCAFVYVGESDNEMAATANLNVVSMTADALAGSTPSEYADSIKEAFDGMDGYTVTADSEGELNGYETYNLTIEYEISDYTMVINQVILSNDSTLVAISYGAFDSVLDELQPEFDKVLSTFAFN